jgi:hypothetical protein
VNDWFRHHYNEQRPHQGLSCGNRPQGHSDQPCEIYGACSFGSVGVYSEIAPERVVFSEAQTRKSHTSTNGDFPMADSAKFGMLRRILRALGLSEAAVNDLID